MNNNKIAIEQLEEITLDESCLINGGGIGGIVVYSLNGACVGLAKAFVNSLTNDEWTGTDTRNCIVTGAATGFCIGLVFPF